MLHLRKLPRIDLGFDITMTLRNVDKKEVPTSSSTQISLFFFLETRSKNRTKQPASINSLALNQPLNPKKKEGGEHTHSERHDLLTK